MNLKEKLIQTKAFQDNEWLDKYVALIISNRDRDKEKGKTQSHHIIPKSYYKRTGISIDNSNDNLINLLYKDHILAHKYLAMCSLDEEIRLANATAFYTMFGNSNYSKELSKEELDDVQELYEFYCTKMVESGKLSSDSIDFSKRIFTPEGRAIISSNAKRKKSNLIRNNMRLGHLNRSEEDKIQTSLKMSKAKKGKPNPKSGEARRGISKPEVSKKLKGKPQLDKTKYTNIYCLELNEFFSSLRDVTIKYPQYKKSTISIYLSGKSKCHLCYGMIWSWGISEEESKKDALIKKEELKNLSSRNSKSIKNIDTGEIYSSITEAELKYSGKVTGAIGNAIREGGKSYGYHWEFVN